MYALSAEIEEIDGVHHYVLIVEAQEQEPIVVAHGTAESVDQAIEKIKEGLDDVL